MTALAADMKIDAFLPDTIVGTPESARGLEAQGYAGVWIPETSHDPFVQAVRVVEATESIQVATGVAIAFARNPMTVAATSWDLAALSGGRFALGLGSQIQSHIERRFSMPWSRPAARMREFVLAIRAIWDCWGHGGRLAFEGEFYTHTLMAPLYVPAQHGFGLPPIYVAGVGERMTEAAGEVADGFIAHSFSTERYVREVTVPALERGLERAGSSLASFSLYCPTFVATGRDGDELARAVEATRQHIAFYASTPAYRRVLELEGWGDVQSKLLEERDRSAWPALVDDELLHAVAVVGSPTEVAAALRARHEGVAARVSLYTAYESDPALWREVLAALGRPDAAVSR